MVEGVLDTGRNTEFLRLSLFTLIKSCVQSIEFLVVALDFCISFFDFSFLYIPSTHSDKDNGFSRQRGHRSTSRFQIAVDQLQEVNHLLHSNECITNATENKKAYPPTEKIQKSQNSSQALPSREAKTIGTTSVLDDQYQAYFHILEEERRAAE